jgi:hypothetical protein
MTDIKLRRLGRKRSTEMEHATRFTTFITESTDDTSLDDCDYYRERLQETLKRQASLDDIIQGPLNDCEYMADVSKPEEYIDAVKRAIRKAKREIENRISSTRQKVNPAKSTYASLKSVM